VTSRRQYLRLLGGAGLGLLAAACSAAPSAQPTAPAPAPTTAPASTAPASSAQATAAPAATAPAAAAAKPSTSSVRMLFNSAADPAFVPDFIAFRTLKDQYGVNVDMQQISGADIAIKSIVAGQVDLALASLASGILAVGQGQKVKAVVPESSAPYFSLITTSDINDWPDLKGKRIGITATSDGSYWTTVLQLRKYNVDPESIDWVTVRGTPARVEAMQAGKIDAAQVQVGGAQTLLKDPKFKRFAQVGKDYPNLLFNVFWSSENFLRDHADVLQLFAQAEMQAHRTVQDKAAFLQMAPQVLEGNPDQATLSQAYDIVKDMNIWDPDEARWNAEAGDFAARTLADFQAVEKFVPFSDWATTQFVDEARQKLGPYKA
jgi:ABC-type nitrate/sulfonate/bicarbonate transport system substrate-binding protein